MKIENASKLAVALAAFIAMAVVPAAHGQSRPFAVLTPSSPILPMSNPIGASGSPVQPAVASPFIRYGGTSTEVVQPTRSQRPASQASRPDPNPPESGRFGSAVRPENAGRDQQRGRGVVLVPVPYYYPDSYYRAPEPTVTIPGQLPNVPYDYSRQTSFNSNPSASPVAASTFVYEPQPAATNSEPRMIIHEPQPGRVLAPPSIGTSRAEVVMRLGQPFGIIRSGGNESLYFDGGLVVVIAPDGRVVQTR